MNRMRRPFFVAPAFLVLAALLRYGIGPFSELLPADYANAVDLSEEAKFRDSPTGAWQASALKTRRVDQTITSSGQVSIIEGALHVYFASGAVNFETVSLYGVDRRTRLNLPGYGVVDRAGQYLFPPHVERIEYAIWDPMFVGLRQATFERVEQIEGLEVYVFAFRGAAMDESEGYSYLPDVPERYEAHTDGQGTLWVEPLSGIVVDYLDSGVSYFAAPSTGARVADFNQWEERYTPETRSAQAELARAASLRILLLEVWLPAVSLAAGLVALFVGFVTRKSDG